MNLNRMNARGFIREGNICIMLAIGLIAISITLYPSAKKSYYAVKLDRAIVADNEQDVRSLLERGVDPNWCPGDATHLIVAIQNDRIAIVKLLIEKGADANKKDYLGRTALQQAKKRGNQKMVQLLAEAGARDVR